MNREINVLESNKLIASFIGWKEDHSLDYNYDRWLVEESHHEAFKAIHLDAKNFEFHSSWDWLMPVVERIEEISTNDYIGFKVEIRRKFCAVYCYEKDKQDGIIYQTPFGFKHTSKIEAVYLAVVSFITWYGSNK